MAEISIDHSKLPGVKEVCRDFAVLEDHTLAHNLQEQEIEHHLATNVQRNRLVQHDLQMAKQLQEEEDRRAQARIQERHKDLEWQDCEMAQEIQVKLVIEAEERRRQEEDDEDIARLLQQKELQEGKRKKKPHPEPLPRDPYEEGYYPESREHPCRSPREQASEHAGPRPPRGDDSELPRERRRGPPLVSEGLDLEVLGSSSEVKAARGGWRHNRERKEGSQEKLQRPPLDQDDAYVERGGGGSKAHREREPASRERAQGSSLLTLDGEAEHAVRGHKGGRERRERRPRSRERNPRPFPLALDLESGEAYADRSNGYHKQRERQSPVSGKSLRPPSRTVDMEESLSDWRSSNSRSPNTDGRRLPLEDRQSPRASRDFGLQDLEALPHRRGPRKAAERELTGMGPRARASPQHGEEWEMDPGSRRSPGMKSRGSKEAIYQKPRPVAQEQEFYDAEIARKLQEEELLASHVDKRAAQVAQDEEIARLLMAEEKKAYKKAKEWEKGSSDKRRRDQDWKHDAHESVHPKSRDSHEAHRSRSNKPTRPPPPSTEDRDPLPSSTSQHNPAHQISKPEPSHKGYHSKQ